MAETKQLERYFKWRRLIFDKFIASILTADKITIYFIVGAMFLTATANLGLFLATLLHYLFPEDEEERDEKK